MTWRSHRAMVAANWKMNHLRADAVDRLRVVKRSLAEHPVAARVAVFPSFPLIPVVAAELAGTEVAVGGQDLHPDDKGAHTGDVSGPQLADAGCSWVLCGHSERRQDHGESDGLVGTQGGGGAAQRPRAPGLHRRDPRGEARRPHLRRAGAAAPRRHGPLCGRPGRAQTPSPWPTSRCGPSAPARRATPETAQEVHAFLRLLLGELIGETAAMLPILYGGSATPDNAAGLFAQPDVDGFLVGGASLDPQKFLAIIRHSG